MPLEALFPQGAGCLELASSGWSQVLRIDAVGRPPNCDFTNQCGGMSFSRSPGWRVVTLAGVILDSVDELGDNLGSLCQVVAPDGIGMEP